MRMPELTAIHIALLVATTIVGAVAGWVYRGNRSEQEKAAVTAGWQEQIEAQRQEHERLVDQNKSLMVQVSQIQAQHTDAQNRAKELSLAIQEAFQRRDQLQRDIKDIRANLETAVNERDQLFSSMQSLDDAEDLLRQKDARIEKLEAELKNWQDRLPPLIARFRQRNEEAEQLEVDLAEAQKRILELENAEESSAANETHIEPVDDPDALTDGREACNDPAKGDGDTVAERTVARTSHEHLNEDDGELPSPRASRDDLKMIKGVGPAIEKTLNEMGIFHFRQIADMSEYDIDRVARRLKGFHSRIYREDWIGQARAILDEAAHA
jgi:predicted flap endonuclease-1-like 5' DNA nuclease/peptidoglycan hydrolase CwlO-like protein